MTTTCPRCAAATSDGALCTRCTSTLRRTLHDIAHLWPTLVETVTRQDRTGTPSEIRSHDAGQPIPFREHAAQLAQDVHAILASWMRAAHQDLGIALPADDQVPAIAWRLHNAVPALRRHEAAADLTNEIVNLADRIQTEIDLPTIRTRITIGPCPNPDCDGTMQATIHDDPQKPSTITCTTCGNTTTINAAEPGPTETLIHAILTKTQRLKQQREFAQSIIRSNR